MKVELIWPDEMFAGTEISLHADIRCEQITRVTGVTADVVGVQGWTLRSTTEILHEERRAPEHTVKLLEPKLLAAHKPTRCTFRVALPDAMPPTHTLDPAFSYFEIVVRVAIAGGKTHESPFRLPVRAATQRIVTRTPASARTKATGATAPRLELSLASTRLVAGEEMVGSAALFNTGDRAQDVDLVLESTLRLAGKRHDYITLASHRFAAAVPAAGRMVTFKSNVPATAMPSFTAATHAVTWRLVARARRLELELPIEILDASAGAATASLTAAPRLADARVATVFEAFAAQQGWRVDVNAIAITRAELQLAYEQRVGEGTFLVATCRAPSLGLGLEVTPRTLFGSSIALGVPAWDARYQVRARSADQALAPLRTVVPSLLSAGVLGQVARWTDEELVMERHVTGVDTHDLLAASDALSRIVANLRRARELVPPPIAVDLAAWQALARAWGGELRAGDLAITAMLDGAPVSVSVRFDERGAAIALVASVGPTPRAVRDATLDVDWPTELGELRVAEGVAHATISVARLDAAHIRTLVTALRGVVARLEPATTGPYR